MDWKTMVRMAMAAQRISGATLSARMGKGASYIVNLLGRDVSPTMETLQNIADALGYDMALSFVDRETGRRIDA
jgi:transcriptional regulator with XRE-family HTH domain